MNKPVLAKSKAIIIFLVFALGYFISTLLRAITARMDNFEIKSKVNRETEISGEKIKLHIPAEKCCIYENNKLI